MDNYYPGPRGMGVGGVIVVSVLTSAIVSVLSVFGLQALQVSIGGGDNIEVPELAGMGRQPAGELLENRGLRLVVRDEQPSADVERGLIIEHTPMAGSRVAEGTEVMIIVSSGPPQVAVPAVLGKVLAQARADLEAAGLVVGPVATTGTGTPDTVTATSPAPGTQVTLGDTVSITAVLPEPEGVEVPSVVGQSRRRARAALRAIGLDEGRIRMRFDDMRGPYVVLGQDPAAGTRVPPGTKVNLVINED